MKLTNREKAAAILLYDDLSMDIESIAENYEHDYLTIVTGRDNKIYAWYYDGAKEGAICVDDLRILSEEEINNLLI